MKSRFLLLSKSPKIWGHRHLQYVYLAVLDKLGLISINEHCSKLSIDFFSQLQMTYRASVLSLNTKKWLFVANKSTKWRANFRFDWPKWPEFHWLRSNWVDKSQKGLVLLLQLLPRVCCWLFFLVVKNSDFISRQGQMNCKYK